MESGRSLCYAHLAILRHICYNIEHSDTLLLAKAPGLLALAPYLMFPLGSAQVQYHPDGAARRSLQCVFVVILIHKDLVQVARGVEIMSLSLPLKWTTCTQQIIGSHLCIQADRLCLLLGRVPTTYIQWGRWDGWADGCLVGFFCLLVSVSPFLFHLLIGFTSLFLFCLLVWRSFWCFCATTYHCVYTILHIVRVSLQYLCFKRPFIFLRRFFKRKRKSYLFCFMKEPFALVPC